MGEQRERPKRWAEAKGGRRWRNPLVVLIWIEWICEWIAYWLSQWAFISILEYLGRLAIVLALALWIIEIPERKQAQANQRKAKIYQAWQVINTARGETASGGRHHALRDLIDERQRLHQVDLSQANLSGADLSGAKLSGADLSAADLTLANLSGADLHGADLSGAKLGEANFSEANLTRANLTGADLTKADLSGANLSWADLTGADLSRADLRGADLRALRNWRKMRWLTLANVWEVRNAPDGFLACAIGEEVAVSVENDDEWKAILEEYGSVLYNAWKKKWDEEHGDRE